MYHNISHISEISRDVHYLKLKTQHCGNVSLKIPLEGSSEDYSGFHTIEEGVEGGGGGGGGEHCHLGA